MQDCSCLWSVEPQGAFILATPPRALQPPLNPGTRRRPPRPGPVAPTPLNAAAIPKSGVRETQTQKVQVSHGGADAQARGSPWGFAHLDAHGAIPLRRVGRWRRRLPVAVGGALHRDVLTRLRSADGSGGLLRLRRDGKGADVVHRAAQVRRELQPKHPTPHVRQDEDQNKEGGEEENDTEQPEERKKCQECNFSFVQDSGGNEYCKCTFATQDTERVSDSEEVEETQEVKEEPEP